MTIATFIHGLPRTPMAVSAGQPTGRTCLSTYELGFGTKRPPCQLRARSEGRPRHLTDTHGQAKMPPSCGDAGHSASRAHSQADSASSILVTRSNVKAQVRDGVPSLGLSPVWSRA